MNGRALIGAALGLLLLAGLLGFFFFERRNRSATPQSIGQSQPAETMGTPHHGWTPFYFAESGTWRILDVPAYVLRERKFTSSDRERDEYTVKRVNPGGIVRTVESHGRWKRVEVLEGTSVVATGWIDAHFVENVEAIPGATPLPATEEALNSSDAEAGD